jgi:ribose 5-phosphate isomerase A
LIFFFLNFFFGIDGKKIVNDVETDNNANKCDYKIIDGDENIETPKRGMTFGSIEELSLYYKRFANTCGFGVVQKKLYKDDNGRVVRITLACSRQGKLKPKTSKSNPTTKTGCKANLNAKLVDNLWFVTSVKTNHNHGLSPEKLRYYKCNRILNSTVKKADYNK